MSRFEVCILGHALDLFFVVVAQIDWLLYDFFFFDYLNDWDLYDLDFRFFVWCSQSHTCYCNDTYDKASAQRRYGKSFLFSKSFMFFLVVSMTLANRDYFTGIPAI
jgi:hypothetical protein